MFFDVEQYGTVNVIDDKAENQPHAEMMSQSHTLVAEKQIDGLKQPVHRRTWRMQGIHGKTGKDHQRVDEKQYDVG